MNRADDRSRRNRYPLGPLERMEPRALLATLTVNSVADAVNADGGLTLREAIMVSNGDLAVSSLSAQEQAQVSGPLATGPAPNTIAFDLPGSGVRTISPTSELPTISKPLVIDGYTQAGAHPNTLAVGTNAALLVALDGSMAGLLPTGLNVAADNSVVRGLALGNFGAAIVASGSGDVVRGDFIGADPSGMAAFPNRLNGVTLQGARGATVGGTAAADRNLISGNAEDGVILSAATDSFVQGNLIGTDATGVDYAQGTAAPASPSRARSRCGTSVGGTAAGESTGSRSTGPRSARGRSRSSAITTTPRCRGRKGPCWSPRAPTARRPSPWRGTSSTRPAARRSASYNT